MKFQKKILVIIIILVAINSCKKLDLVPSNKFTDSNFWTTNINVNNALNNNYRLMYNDNLYFYNDDMSDNAYSSNNDPIATGSFNASTSKFLTDWTFYYSGINSCNLFLANVDQNKKMTPALIARMKGEVRFIRAFHYFNLMKWWGDVPLITSVITPDQAKVLIRSPRATVINFILSELDSCATILPPKEQYAATDNGRITSGAALALKARALLYEGNRMQDVVTVCQKLFTGSSTYGNYSLSSDYGSLFSNTDINKNNPETILSLQFVEGTPGRTWSDDYDFAPISTGARVNSLAPTQELINDYIMANGKQITDQSSGYDETNPYANRDPRLSATIAYDKYPWLNPDGTTQIIYIKPGTDPSKPPLNEYVPGNQAVSQSGYYWRKYFDPNHLPGFVSGLNLHLIRWAEVLLDYAEAQNSLGQMNATVWNQTIGQLRLRAGFTNSNALNYPGNADITNIIRRERRAELAMEGLRTEDIRRWKLSEIVLNGYAHGAKFSDPTVDSGYIRVQLRHFDPTKNYFWPIPQSELNLDKNLLQNTGY